MSDRAAIQQSLDQFFEAIEQKDMSLLPLGDEALYSGTLMPKPVEGAGAVRQHMSETAPFIKSIHILDSLIDGDQAAVLVRYEGINAVVFEGCYFISFDNSQIIRIRTVFDSRPLMQGRFDH